MLVPLHRRFVCCRRRRRRRQGSPPSEAEAESRGRLLRQSPSQSSSGGGGGSAEGMFRVFVEEVYASWFVLRFVNTRRRFPCTLRPHATAAAAVNYRLFITPGQVAWVENPAWDVDPAGSVTRLTVTLYGKDDMLRSVNEHMHARATATLATACSLSLSSSCAVQ